MDKIQKLKQEKQYEQYVTNQPIVICSKGFEKDTMLTLDEVIKEEIPNAKIAVLSGPSHAEEVSIAVPTVLVVASEYDSVLKLVQDTFMSDKMRIYTSRDVKGVELGGALKNIIAKEDKKKQPSNTNAITSSVRGE